MIYITYYTFKNEESVVIYGTTGLNNNNYSSKLYATECNHIFKRKQNVDCFLKYTLDIKSNDNYYLLKDLNDLYKLL